MRLSSNHLEMRGLRTHHKIYTIQKYLINEYFDMSKRLLQYHVYLYSNGIAMIFMGTYMSGW